MEPRIGPLLVTGASGYLGARVLILLQAAQVPAIGVARDGTADVKCDLLDHTAVLDAVRDIRPKVIVHCAAAVPKSADGYGDNDAAEKSLLMVQNIIRAGVERVLFTSSMTVYGPSQQMPVSECTTAPDSAYARAKLAAEQLLLHHDKTTTVVLRLPGLFGLPRRSGLVYRLCHAAVAKVPITLPSEPTLWAAMHVDDAADIIVRAAVNFPAENVVANVGYPEVFSISRLVCRLTCLSGAKIAYAVCQPEFQMDLTSLANSFGLPSRNFNNRLLEMLDYARNEI